MSNAHEYSVSELAFALKATVEQTYGRVRVRGELGRVTIAKSGHAYLDIKDDKAVINSIMWKGVVSRLPMQPEEGMEVIAEGKMSTYPGRSNYQLIIDRMEPAGVGALMALLEKRKKQFASEGLFDEDRKKELPYLPRTIGVVTSPTGSVIRDILHRIEDRFPVHVLVWPALVQGDRAAEQIAAGINGFNSMAEGYGVSKPDVIIVARGGGSLEDLWCFNEEIVARAAANSDIPLISAVGHETDWTIIDYIADYRAPTPTGAAEVAVPVRAELAASVDDYAARLRRGLLRTSEQKRLQLSGAHLPKLASVLLKPVQDLDLLMARLAPALRLGHERRKTRLSLARLSPQHLTRQSAQSKEQVSALAQSQKRAMHNRLEALRQRLDKAGQLLGAYSYQGVLSRGYALVTDEAGAVVRDGAALKSGQGVELTFQAGVRRKAVIDGQGGAAPSSAAPSTSKSKPKSKPKRKSAGRPKSKDQSQMGLF